MGSEPLKQGSLPFCACSEAAEAEAPACRAGGVIIFDYRLIHGGLPSRGGRERPVAYAVVATGGATDDSGNFPDARIRDATRAAVSALPFWDELEFVQ